MHLTDQNYPALYQALSAIGAAQEQEDNDLSVIHSFTDAFCLRISREYQTIASECFNDRVFLEQASQCAQWPETGISDLSARLRRFFDTVIERTSLTSVSS